MSVLGMILGIEPRTSSAPDPTARDAFDRPEVWSTWSRSVPTSAGERVGPDSALTLSVYYGCIKVLAEDVGKVSWHLYRRTGENSRTRATDDPRYYLVHDAPDDEQSDITWRETMVAWALGWGNGYAEIVRDERGAPVALSLIHPSRVEVKRINGQVAYEIRIDDIEEQRRRGIDGRPVYAVRLRAEDVFHLRNLGEGLQGWSVARLAAETIGHAQAVRRFGSSFFGNGTNLGGVLTHPGKLSPEARTNLMQSWKDRYQGPGKAFKTALLEEGLDWKQVSVPPEQAQFVETIRATVPEICNWFRVPMYKLNMLDGTPRANIEQLSIDYVGDTVLTWSHRLDKEADRKLRFESERSTLYFEHNLSSLLRADAKARGEFYKTGLEMGWVTHNEVRALENLDDIGEDGDQHLVPLNLTTLERVRTGQQPPADDERERRGSRANAPAPEPEDETDDETDDPDSSSRSNGAGALLPHPPAPPAFDRQAALKATARLFVAGAERSIARLSNAADRKSKLGADDFRAWAGEWGGTFAADLAANLEAPAEALLELIGGPEHLVRERRAALGRLGARCGVIAADIVGTLRTADPAARAPDIALAAQAAVTGDDDDDDRPQA